jgi:antitoxin FitA
MQTMQLLDMSAPRINVLHMSKMIQIRNVPDEMHQMLKMRAMAEGISLSDLIKRELGITTELMSFEEMDARVRARRKRSKATTAEIVQIIRESRGELP